MLSESSTGCESIESLKEQTGEGGEMGGPPAVLLSKSMSPHVCRILLEGRLPCYGRKVSE
jgi:hypothetical protein